MNRYSIIDKKIKREIVLLKGRPCLWGRCTFCDYIEDNSVDEKENIRINDEVLKNITGQFGVLEVINSGNVFELPQDTLDKIRQIIIDKKINTVFFEAHWLYRKKIQRMREFFAVKVIVKTGLETFDEDFRENVLNKGFEHKSIGELKENFDSVCLMVGIKGQTKEMIRRDIKLADENFDHFTVNIYVPNSTEIKEDRELIGWFEKEYDYLERVDKCDVLWVNTDFGVGD